MAKFHIKLFNNCFFNHLNNSPFIKFFCLKQLVRRKNCSNKILHCQYFFLKNVKNFTFFVKN